MGPSRNRNSTRRAAKARSLKPSTKLPHKSPPSPAKKRLAKRKPATEVGSAAFDGLREMRRAGDGASLRYRQAVEAVGTQLRGIVTRLKLVEKYLIVCRLALDGQAVECDAEIALLLKRAVGDLLFEQVRELENVAAKCDGGLPSNRDDDDEIEDDDTEGGQ